MIGNYISEIVDHLESIEQLLNECKSGLLSDSYADIDDALIISDHIDQLPAMIDKFEGLSKKYKKRVDNIPTLPTKELEIALQGQANIVNHQDYLLKIFVQYFGNIFIIDNHFFLHRILGLSFFKSSSDSDFLSVDPLTKPLVFTLIAFAFKIQYKAVIVLRKKKICVDIPSCNVRINLEKALNAKSFHNLDSLYWLAQIHDHLINFHHHKIFIPEDVKGIEYI